MIRTLLVAVSVAGAVVVPAVVVDGQTKESPIVVGDKIPEPKRIKTVAPAYPIDAATGSTILRAVVDPQGKVDTVSVLRSVPRATPAAVAAVRQWEYEPLVHEGEAAWCVMTLIVPSPWREPRQ